MKVVEIIGEQECAVVDRPMPVVHDNYALIKILAAPMCTEVGAYRSGQKSDSLGHEAAGIVVECGPACRAAPGQRVVVMPQNGCGACELCLSGEHIRCQNQRNPLQICGSETGRATYAEYCIQQDWLLFNIPDDLTIDQASMACCGLGPTFNACQIMNVNTLDTVLISGLGAVGLGGVVNAKFRGARVIGLESNQWRANLAQDLGADLVVDPSTPDALAQILAFTSGRGADKSIEASSAESAPEFLTKATKINGELTTVGWGGPIFARDITAKGITVRGAWHWNHRQHSKAMERTLIGTLDKLNKLITHRLPMSNVKEAWEIQLTGRCGKIILHPWE